MRHAIILAGGKGTRLASRLDGKPKPLIDIAGIPLLERQMMILKQYGVCSATLLVNHKAEQIVQFCRDRQDFGMNISIVDDGEPRGTAGAVLAAAAALPSSVEEFLVVYGDTLFNINLEHFFAFHVEHGGDATLFLHPNDHPHDSDLVEINTDSKIVAFHPYPHPQGKEYANLVNAALYIVKRSSLQPWLKLADEPPRIVDFAKELFPQMLEAGKQLYGWSSHEYIRDVGTPERLDKATHDIASGIYQRGSSLTPRAAVFLDRDGVINKEVGFLNHREQFVLLPGAAEAIRKLNRKGMLVVVITNQPVLARGECTEDELQAIHARMDYTLGKQGAFIDRLYYCPHHPDKGFPGEVSELKITCSCRKPEIGLLLKAQADMNIDMRKSWMVGDRTGDILAGSRAGVRTILVQTGDAGKDGKYAVTPDHICADILSAVDDVILSN